MVSSPGGAVSLSNIVREGGLDNLVSNPPAWLSGGNAIFKVMALGQQLLGRIFGIKTTAVSEVVAKSSGVSAKSANRLLCLAAPLTMDALNRHVISQGLDAFGLSNLISEQTTEISAAAPAGLLQVLDASGPIIVPPAKNRSTANSESEQHRDDRQSYPSVEQRRTEKHGGWLPWFLLAVAGFGLFLFLKARSAQHVNNVAVSQARNVNNYTDSVAERTALKSITLPGGAHLSVPAESVSYSLSTYLGSSAEVPITFVVDHMTFEPSATQLTSESYPTVSALASILKAYPHARVQLAGYTDNVGDPRTNRTVSLNRALLVKALLAAHGVNSARVIAVGLGSDHPVTSNNTESERAQNNRLELTVTSKYNGLAHE
jgi:outer membrane protein OmpA-like peptidoglycan-associated protein